MNITVKLLNRVHPCPHRAVARLCFCHVYMCLYDPIDVLHLEALREVRDISSVASVLYFLPLFLHLRQIEHRSSYLLIKKANYFMISS